MHNRDGDVLLRRLIRVIATVPGTDRPLIGGQEITALRPSTRQSRERKKTVKG